MSALRERIFHGVSLSVAGSREMQFGSICKSCFGRRIWPSSILDGRLMSIARWDGLVRLAHSSYWRVSGGSAKKLAEAA
jgi:hypothetical protein